MLAGSPLENSPTTIRTGTRYLDALLTNAPMLCSKLLHEQLLVFIHAQLFSSTLEAVSHLCVTCIFSCIKLQPRSTLSSYNNKGSMLPCRPFNS